MTLQQEIIQKLHVQPSISPREEIRKTIDFMKDYVKKQWDKGAKIESFVLGISGGQDSTLLGKLAQIAADELKVELDIPFQFIALRLPYGVQADATDALDALTFIQPDKQFTVQIETAVNASYNAFTSATDESLSDFLKGNIKARERMKVQYDFAGHYRGLVLGTDHAAEAVTGFFTKWGDGACDLAPLFRLTKSQGRQMLIELGCPSHLYDKVPTADLEENKPLNPDETALGVTYHEIDNYLIGKEINSDSKERIESHYLKTEHKRQGVVTLFDTWWKV